MPKRVARITVACRRCGRQFQMRQSRLDRGQGKFCSVACIVGHDAKSTLVERTCESCKKQFSHRLYLSKPHAGRFCSEACMGRNLPKLKIGDLFTCLQCRSESVVSRVVISRGRRKCENCIRRNKRSERPRDAAARLRKWHASNPGKSTEYQRRWLAKNPEKAIAHRAMNAAIKRGVLTRSACVDCGATERVHGHHQDYSKPLDVIWLCQPCHMRRHRKTA
jgi:hypothetical protein